MYNFQVVCDMKKNGINVVGPTLKFMRYVAYIHASEKEISDAISTGDSDYAWSEITRVERERHEYHDEAIKAVKALNQIAVDHGYQVVYEEPTFRRDVVTDFCIQYLKEAK